MKTKDFFYSVFFLAIFTFISAFFGILYSIYNTDAHHWGFVASNAIDAVQGKLFFKEIYVQYGVGGPLFFKYLHSLFHIPIHFTSIGIITAFIYALHLGVIFISVKKIAGLLLAALITTLALLIHTYSIYPWPDYDAGFTLAMACYLMLSPAKNILRFSAVGALFFLTFFFRNTYIVSFVAATLAYAGFCFFDKTLRNKSLVLALGLFFTLTGLYLFSVYHDGNFALWYQQGLGSASSSHYHLGLEALWKLLLRAFLPAKVFRPDYASIFALAICLHLSVYWAIQIFKKTPASLSLQSSLSPGVALFLILLGLAGILQAIHGYEVFRVQNSCTSLYLVLALFLKNKKPPHFIGRNRFLYGMAVVLLITLLVRFPNASAYFKTIEGEVSTDYESKISFFENHRFQESEKNYFETLAMLLCDGHSKILNLTMDSTVPYLCDSQLQSKILALPFYFPEMSVKINPVEMDQIARGDFNSGSMIGHLLIVSEAPTISTNGKTKFEEKGRIFRPDSIRFIKGAMVYVFKKEQ